MSNVFDPLVFDPLVFDTVAVVSEKAFTFADFLAWPDRDVVILVECTPAVQLVGWTAVGVSAPNVYQIALPRFIQTTRIRGGVYRRCIGVAENATALTAQTSVADVNTTPLSWYWDELAGVLYVRTSTGSDPDVFTVYQGFVTFYMASKGITLDLADGDPATGVYYQPWLIGELPRLSQQVEDILFGAKLTEIGDVSFTNGHGVWFPLVAPNGEYMWKNKRAQFLLGGSANGQALRRSQFLPLATMLIEDLAADEERCVLTVKPLSKRLDMEVPITPYFPDSYPNLGDGVSGTKKWVGYGRTRMRPDLTDQSGDGIWTIADASVQTLFAVHAVDAVEKTTGVRSTLLETYDYIVALGACTITIVNPTYRWQDYDIEVDVTGKPDGNGGYLQTFSAIVEDLLVTFANVHASDLDAPAFAQAALDAPEELALWIKSPRSLASILSTAEPGFASLERSVNGYVIQTLDGKWTCRIWSPNSDTSTLPRFRKEDLARFQPQPKLETVFATTRVQFDFNHARNEWDIEEDTDATVQYLAETTDRLDIFTFLKQPADALNLAHRYQFISGAVALEIEFEERGITLARALAGDRLLVTYAPAPDISGAFTDKLFELIRLDLAFNPELRISGRIGDLRGVADVGQWTPDTAPPWSAATLLQRQDQGFWTDENAFADPADPTSKSRSLWW
jgi:hypothetical protein